MKKIYLATLILLTVAGLRLQAQDLTAPHPVLNYSGPSTSGLLGEFDVVNSSSQSLDVIVESYNRNLAPGHSTYFCWFLCYDTNTTRSPNSDFLTLAPGASTSNFHSYMIPADATHPNSPGHDEICYRFFDVNGMSDTLSVCMTYDFMPTGITEISTKGSFNFSGPNPANTYSSIRYLLNGKTDARLIVTNMLGSKVSEIKLNDHDNSLTLSVKDLNNGVYVYSLVVDGKMVSSKRLVVAH